MIRRFDVYPRPGVRRASDAPYVVVLQSHFAEWNSVIVAPLLTTEARFDVARLVVRVRVANHDYAVFVAELAPVPRRLLRDRVDNLLDAQDEIRRALDFLFEGF